MAETQTRPNIVPEAQLRFTYLKVQNWRNFVDLNLKLQKRCFLVGPNASGKSNFLDIFRFLRDIVDIGGGFQEAIRKRGGVKQIRCLAARRYPEIEIEIWLGTDSIQDLWQYQVAFTQDNNRNPTITKERVLRNKQILLNRPNDSDKSDPEQKRQTYLEQLNVNKEFRQLADFFRTLKYLHLVPQLVRDPDRSVGRKNDPYGGDFLEQIARTPRNAQVTRLKKVEEALRAAVPQLLSIRLEKDFRGTPHFKVKYQHWRSKGALQSERDLSDGTLRLTGLLWAVLDGRGPLLLEEPELSLHPGIVTAIPALFAKIQLKFDRQIFISTHSSDLLSDPGIGLDEVVLFNPDPEGTKAYLAKDMKEIPELINSGVNLSELIASTTRPKKVEQLTLALFSDER
ncbi:AAA domain, putative AbiEii toxin, Type IV TA system [uncultured archaeon]|nr:AAA domain, putative AbiEii toxin, Type IV TA system [uncultured archaeon]